jgi:hypothetical protein
MLLRLDQLTVVFSTNDEKKSQMGSTRGREHRGKEGHPGNAKG